MFDQTILQQYARKFESSPSSLPPTLLLTNTETTLTLFDKYPKAIYHFLVLPRILPGSVFTAKDLTNLHTLLAKGRRAEAKTLIEGLKKDTEIVKGMVEKEMVKKHGYKWDVWIGFHAVPSLMHLHLHVISSDLCSPSLKHKRHYNSFHPELGFFLHIDEVLSWFERDSASFDREVISLRQSLQEPLLKEDLECWRCRETFKTLPKLKEHLTREKGAEASRQKKKRKRPEDGRAEEANPDEGEPSSKRQSVTPDAGT
ncbi:HIT-like protein [Thelephora ganbajun]|uniref:HIT-like protein n=1 Tax=Thelephora ganbajun TaxID=370292 RepID=A0ACB6ZPA8_THEGA|nr:HIT-like protein [Thelephora ganbajun]